MLTEQEIRKAVESILAEMGPGAVAPARAASGASASTTDNGILPDILDINLQEVINVPKPHNREALVALKKLTPARIGVWRSGPRYKTSTLLRFRADHAVAMDAVFADVPETWLKDNGLPSFVTKCENKDIFLTRPDLGRRFDEVEAGKVKAHVGSNNRVVVFVADGLSTTAVVTNALDTYRAISEGLSHKGIKIPPPFFIKHGRVPIEDSISEITGAEVVCALIGERPGLITAESMSAYIAYKAKLDMPEARRTCVSNIHRQGTPAVEAGAYIADIIMLMLEKKQSGLELNL